MTTGSHLPRSTSAEVRYTVQLGGRDPHRLILRTEEAEAMYALGFRFSIFNEVTGEFNLSIPYAMMWSFDHDAVTFIQDG